MLSILYDGAHMTAEMRSHGKTNFPKYSAVYERHLQRFDWWMAKHGLADEDTLIAAVQAAEPVKPVVKPSGPIEGSVDDELEPLSLSFL
jgi:hypothetical protein